MYYSPGIRFETSLFNMYETKELIKINQLGKSNSIQQKRYQCGAIKNLCITHMNLPVKIETRKANKLAFGIGLYQSEANKARE